MKQRDGDENNSIDELELVSARSVFNKRTEAKMLRSEEEPLHRVDEPLGHTFEVEEEDGKQRVFPKLDTKIQLSWHNVSIKA